MTARILIIAGSDSSGGAGIQADIKTVTMLGGHAMTAVTAITAQNTVGVQAVHPVPTDMVIAQINSVVSDIGVDAIKIGMIGSPETCHAVADYMQDISVPIVFDPVMVATSGSLLADVETVRAFDRLMEIASLTTPNLPELEALGGREALLRRHISLLIKGGHSEGRYITDRLDLGFNQSAVWSSERIDTHSTHGTGCTLASAVATGLGQGMPMQQAVERARQFVRYALLNAPGLGAGHGPMGHGHVRAEPILPGPNLNQITLGSSDYAASVAFYVKLGLTQIVDSPRNGYARFEAANGVTFSIHADDTPPVGAVVYFEHARLGEYCDGLAKAGVEFEKMPSAESWGWTEARLRDPHGNLLCLYSSGENRRFPPWRI
ncbi:MAG: bifunctional hydroxymethylpyrimidine kinase/phosphomethylpyrimidine kinase [Sphingorhabdus sp.]